MRAVVHPALEPDRWCGRTHVSLVAFDFLETRVLGVPVPGLVRFPEINLRTYVTDGERRGVQFVRELVPSGIVAAVARLGYNEPYYATPMRSRVADNGRTTRASHRFHWDARDRPELAGSLRAVREHHVKVTGSTAAHVPPADSEAHHFKEHAWGFGATRRGRLLRYRVDHPVWAVRDVQSVDYDVDFAAVYGKRWAPLNEMRPASVVFAVGSAVKVYLPEK